MDDYIFRVESMHASSDTPNLQPRDIISGIQVATGDLGLAGALRVQASDCDSNASTAHCVSQLHYLHTTTRTTVSSLSLPLALALM